MNFFVNNKIVVWLCELFVICMHASFRSYIVLYIMMIDRRKYLPKIFGDNLT